MLILIVGSLWIFSIIQTSQHTFCKGITLYTTLCKSDPDHIEDVELTIMVAEISIKFRNAREIQRIRQFLPVGPKLTKNG